MTYREATRVEKQTKQNKQQKHAEEKQGFLAGYWGDRRLQVYLRCRIYLVSHSCSSTHPSTHPSAHPSNKCQWTEDTCSYSPHNRISEKPLLYNLSEEKKAINIFIFKNLLKPHLLFSEMGIPTSLSSTSIIYFLKNELLVPIATAKVSSWARPARSSETVYHRITKCSKGGGGNLLKAFKSQTLWKNVRE